MSAALQSQIYYSDKYTDDEYEYRWVKVYLNFMWEIEKIVKINFRPLRALHNNKNH